VKPFSDHIEKEIRQRVSGECSFDGGTREQYSTDAGWYKVVPIGVVYPSQIIDVQALVTFCNENGISVIPRGAATGLAGQAIGYGIIVDFTRSTNHILSQNEDTVTVEPGVVLSVLNEQLRNSGKHFPIDPASSSLCTIGGMIATNAAGSHGIKHGSTKDFVRELSVVLSNGELARITKTAQTDPSGNPLYSSIVKTLSPLLLQKKKLIHEHFPSVAKNSSGYNLRGAVSLPSVDFRQLLVGSEGTLALTVGATLDIIPIPKYRMGALVYLNSYEKTADATLLGLELDPSAIEILDHSYVSLAKGISSEIDAMIHPDAKAMLYFEFEGDSQEDLARSIVRLNRTVSLSLPLKFTPLTTEEEILRLWKLREEASKIINYVKSKGKTSFVEDVAVPLPRLSEYLKGLGDILNAYGIDFSIYGHAGTGNVHCAAFVDLKNLDHYKAVDPIASEVYDLAISLGGTLSGEHGDGFVRTPFLERLYGPEIYDLFCSVKKAFDPNDILNPGKIIGRQNVSILHDLAL